MKVQGKKLKNWVEMRLNVKIKYLVDQNFLKCILNTHS